MKLLLTSAGITNAPIAKALFDLVGKPPQDTSLVFIPTAANVEPGDKTWLIENLYELTQLNFKSVDIADISAIERSVWLPKLEAADVIMFGGGSTYHLMQWINKSGLAQLLPDLLKTRVYVGVSAGSMVACTDLLFKFSQIVYEEDLEQTAGMPGLALVDFYVLPHLNSPYFKKLREPEIRDAARGMEQTVYALDDQSAVKVIDGKTDVISGGAWFAIDAINPTP